MNHPNNVALISSTGDITATSPANNGLADDFKVAFSPADSLKKSIKIDASIFTTFKEGKYWGIWRRNTLVTTIVQDVAEVLNPDYCHATNVDVTLSM